MSSDTTASGNLVDAEKQPLPEAALGTQDIDPGQSRQDPANVDKEPNSDETINLPRSTSGLRSRRSDGGSILVRSDVGSVRVRGDVGSILARHSSVGDAESLASIDRPPNEDEKLPASKIYAPLSFPVIALLIPASIFGVLARLGLQAITTYDGRAIFPLAWVQGAGCLVIGFALGLKEPIGRFYGPLYTAITTGFCGSLTTFSGWQLDVFESWINGTASHRDWFRDAIDGLGKTIFTFAISLSAVTFGAHFSRLVLPYIPTLPPPSRPIRYGLTVLAVLTYAAAYPAYFLLSPSFRHEATAALLFSFPGTLSRYLLSIFLNTRLRLFPLGTFTANMLGTAMLATFQVLRSLQYPGPLSVNACDVLQGLADGYCGCLTTVSTFAAEVDALPPRQAWLYAILSWLTAQILIAVILGPSLGVGHISKEITCRF